MAFKDLFNKAKKYVESEEFQDKVKKGKDMSKKAIKKSTDHVKKEFEFMKNEFSKKKKNKSTKEDTNTESKVNEKQNDSVDNQVKKTESSKETTKPENKTKDSLEIIGLTQKQIEALNKAGYKTIQDLKESSLEEIGKIKGIGKAALTKIENHI
tara:strand:+ start:32074 stop:32535 length:462 start_codon:yes stop_codon:yes gene_type:complete